MERKDVFKHSLKRSEKVKTLLTKTSVKLSSKVEPTIVADLLFQRLVVMANCCNIGLDNCKAMNCEDIHQRCLNRQFKSHL